jgi:DNA-directed RNA polymerase subunit RPC12/RpoP
MSIQCSNCKGVVPQANVLRAQPYTHRSLGPWTELYVARQFNCPACGSRIFHVENQTRREKSSTFVMAGTKMLTEGVDYEVVWKRPRPLKPDGKRPLEVAWLYHPFTNDAAYSRWLRDQIRLSDQLREPLHCRIGILPKRLLAHVKVFSDKDLFDQVWTLDDRWLAGVDGPYPCPQAELATLHTFGRLNLRGLWHYWPSALIPADSFVRFLSDEEMAKKWAVYARQSVEIKLPKEK